MVKFTIMKRDYVQKELDSMKGIKVVLPIVGVFLVFYVVMVIMNTLRVNETVANLNETYGDNFTIVASDMGNVFLDDDYHLSVKSSNTGYIYEFDYTKESIEGTYEMTTFSAMFNEQLEQGIATPIYSFSKVITAEKNLSKKLSDIQIDEIHVHIVSNTSVQSEVKMWLEENYADVDVHTSFYTGSKSAMSKLEQELLPVRDRTNVTEQELALFTFKK